MTQFDTGYHYFETPMLRTGLNINGKQTSICPLFEFPGGPAGVKIDILGGGAVYQSSPPSIHAPLTLAPQSFTAEFNVDIQDDYWFFKRLMPISTREPVRILVEDPMEEVWAIPDTAKLSYTFARSTAYDTLSVATHPMRVAVMNASNWGAAEAVYAHDPTPPPSLGNYSIDQTISTDVLTMPDLSGVQAGNYLAARTYFWRQYVILNVSRLIPEANGMKFTASLEEFVEAKEWSES